MTGSAGGAGDCRGRLPLVAASGLGACCAAALSGASTKAITFASSVPEVQKAFVVAPTFYGSGRPSGGSLWAAAEAHPCPVGTSTAQGPAAPLVSAMGLAACTVSALGRSLARRQRRANDGSRQIRAAAPDKPNPEIDPRPQDPPSMPPPVRMPTVEGDKGEKIDVMSKLLQDRVIILGGEVKDEMAQVLIAQMLYLSNESEEDITMYINSPGGSVSAGMAIFDTMQFIPCEVSTVCFGLAASMGSFLLAAGTKGKRKSLPNSRIMIHQPLGGAQGQAADVRIQAREILHMRAILNQHLADCTGQSEEKILQDCDRDNFMTPEEAKEYGLIDEILETKSWPRIQKPPRPEV